MATRWKAVTVDSAALAEVRERLRADSPARRIADAEIVRTAFATLLMMDSGELIRTSTVDKLVEARVNAAYQQGFEAGQSAR